MVQEITRSILDRCSDPGLESGHHQFGIVEMKLYCERVGEAGPVLLLLHGLAANGVVWRSLRAELRQCWQGRVVIPDLRGHGRSPHGTHYGYGQHAADVAELLEPGAHVSIVGHSMGAVIGLALASGWYGVSVDAVLGLAIKVEWTEGDVEKAHAVARKPERLFETRSEAAGRFLRLSGLAGLVTEDDDIVEAGISKEGKLWRLAFDPRTFSAPGPPLEEVFRIARTRLLLACGAADSMVRIEQIRSYDSCAVELAGLGHNLHVESPSAVAALISRHLNPAA